MNSKPLKSDAYRRLADEATLTAEASALSHVREKHRLAAEKWTNLAELEERSREASLVAAPQT